MRAGARTGREVQARTVRLGGIPAAESLEPCGKSAEITVIVPVRDRPAMLSEMLDSLKLSIQRARAIVPAARVDILVVDDRSERRPVVPGGLQAKVIKGRGVGPGAARNTGAKVAKTEWLLFTDSDCLVSEDWLLTAIQHATTSLVSVVQGDPTRYRASTPFGQQEQALYGHMYAAYLAPDRSRTEMLDSRNLLIRRDIFLGVGGFPVNGTDAMAESRVMAQQLAHAGHTFGFSGRMIVRHQAPLTIEGEMAAKFRHGRGRVGIWGLTPPSEAELAARYFLLPIEAGLDPAYVIPVHIAFLGGYAFEAGCGPAALPLRVLDQMADSGRYARLINYAIKWVDRRSLS